MLVGDLARLPRPWFVEQSSQTTLDNRWRHFPTVWTVTPSRAATSVFATPEALASTILARSASAWAVFGRRA